MESEGEGCCKKCCSCCKQRYVMGMLSGIGVMLAFLMRMCLSMAITQMVKHPPKSENNTGEVICPDDNAYATKSEDSDLGEFDWDDTMQGHVLGSFFYGYFLTHLPGGVMADLFGGKHLLGCSVLISAVATLVSPITARVSPIFLAVIRFIMGLAQGPMFPAFSTLCAKWSPPNERTTINMMVNSGVSWGMILANSLTGLILNYIPQWTLLFYSYGAAGVAWWLFWMFLAYSQPDKHPFITDKEKTYIEESLRAEDKEEFKGRIPWRAMLTSMPLHSINLCNLGHDVIFYFISIEMPLYLSNVLHFPIFQSGLAAGLPWLSFWVGGTIFAILCDWVITKGYIRKLLVRKLMVVTACIIPSALLCLISYLGCDRIVAAAVLTLLMFFEGTCYCGFRINNMDICPRFAGTTMAIINGIGCIAGFLIPIVVPLIITEGGTITQWRIGFLACSAFCVLMTIPFFIFAKADIQPWNEGVSK